MLSVWAVSQRCEPLHSRCSPQSYMAGVMHLYTGLRMRLAVALHANASHRSIGCRAGRRQRRHQHQDIFGAVATKIAKALPSSVRAAAVTVTRQVSLDSGLPETAVGTLVGSLIKWSSGFLSGCKTTTARQHSHNNFQRLLLAGDSDLGVPPWRGEVHVPDVCVDGVSTA